MDLPNSPRMPNPNIRKSSLSLLVLLLPFGLRLSPVSAPREGNKLLPVQPGSEPDAAVSDDDDDEGDTWRQLSVGLLLLLLLLLLAP